MHYAQCSHCCHPQNPHCHPVLDTGSREKSKFSIKLLLFSITFLLISILTPSSYAEDNCSKIKFSNNNKTKAEFNISISDTPQTRAKGLMFKKQLPKNEGMMFVWDKPEQKYMWMKNTYISLDMIFIKDNTIVGIIKNTTPKSLEVLTIEHPVNKILEIKGGLSDKYSLQKGDKFTCIVI
ncbi:MAG: DUF192 domain-containing protein [Proteobacteria bacterium]|nr:DUF192 domain-containing protein [Pseudomonadota bacterium]